MLTEHSPRMLQGEIKFLHRSSFCVYIYKIHSHTYIISFSLMELQTMGMAVMLDEIINYVQSLQNQVEVSSKKFIHYQQNTSETYIYKYIV